MSDLKTPAEILRSADEEARALLAIIDRGFIRVQDRPVIEKVRARLNAPAPRCEKTIDIFEKEA